MSNNNSDSESESIQSSSGSEFSLIRENTYLLKKQKEFAALSQSYRALYKKNQDKTFKQSSKNKSIITKNIIKNGKRKMKSKQIPSNRSKKLSINVDSINIAKKPGKVLNDQLPCKPSKKTDTNLHLNNLINTKIIRNNKLNQNEEPKSRKTSSNPNTYNRNNITCKHCKLKKNLNKNKTFYDHPAKILRKKYLNIPKKKNLFLLHWIGHDDENKWIKRSLAPNLVDYFLQKEQDKSINNGGSTDHPAAGFKCLPVNDKKPLKKIIKKKINNKNTNELRNFNWNMNNFNFMNTIKYVEKVFIDQNWISKITRQINGDNLLCWDSHDMMIYFWKKVRQMWTKLLRNSSFYVIKHLSGSISENQITHKRRINRHKQKLGKYTFQYSSVIRIKAVNMLKKGKNVLIIFISPSVKNSDEENMKYSHCYLLLLKGKQGDRSAIVFDAMQKEKSTLTLPKKLTKLINLCRVTYKPTRIFGKQNNLQVDCFMRIIEYAALICDENIIF